jgi:bifunctional DNA-binding transcriptional regulator/antitoxin component of YhaV-PrlF toxin-antitoxin module
MVRIAVALRRRLDIEPGDELRWDADQQGNLSAEVVKQRYGAFDDFEPVPMVGDRQETHDITGHEEESVYTEDN